MRSRKVSIEHRHLGWIALGGVVGAVARWAILDVLPHPTFPWPVLVVNVAGCVVLGVVVARRLDPALGVGFCGGFTTFSTFAVQVAELARDGRAVIALAYGATSVVACFAAVVAGAKA